MACGCPIVSTNCPSGPEEILDGGRYGHLVPVDDVDALAQAIVQTLQGDRKEVPPHWLDQFATDHISERYLQVLLG
jgi:glycosyltransferase involved in cell wall biosynthesis